MSNTTSASLLLRIRNPEDQDAWEQFMDIYTPVVQSYCLQRRIQRADIDDIVQDVMTSVANAIRVFEYDPAKGKFRAWFGTVAANKIKSFLNRKFRANDLAQEMQSAHSNETYTDPDSDWVDIFSERILQIACTAIRPSFEDGTWACFEATWKRNENATDVARSLKIPVHSVYVNKSRVLKRLEAEIKNLADEMPFSELG